MIGDFRNDQDDPSIRSDGTVDRLVRSALGKPPLPPQGFRIEKAQNGVRCFAADRGRIAPADGRLSGSVAYRVRWVATLDSTSQDSVNAARTRSIILSPTIEASGKDGVEAVAYFQDPKYASGYFLCVGVDAAGNESTEYAGPVQVTNQILDNSVPADVVHGLVSASGEYIGADVVEAVSVSCQAPKPLGSFDGVQLFLKDYINLGSIQEGEFHRFTSGAGGSMQFKVNYSIAKRIGAGTITLTNASTAVTGTKFLTQAQAGDLVECGGVRATISTVNSDTSITLTANWTGTSVTGYSDYSIIAKVTVYLVAISKGGTHRSDVTNSPATALLFDGSLGTPNAPSAGLLATTAGNVIRIEFQQVLGTKIKGYNLYRATGASVSWPSASFSVLDVIPQPKNTVAATSSLIQYEDSSFTTYQKEQGQAFTYYVTTVNERGDESTAAHVLTSGSLDPTCRLDSSQDGDPSVSGRIGLKNMLFNAFIGGTAGNQIAANGTDQDAYNGTSVGNLPGKPYGAASGQAAGTGKFAGYTRWESAAGGGGTTLADYQNGMEARFQYGGASKQVFLYQEIDAWDHATPAQIKIKKNGIYVFSCYVRYDSVGGKPNGNFLVYVEQMNNNALTGYASRRYRDSGTGVLGWYDNGSGSAPLTFACSGLTTGWQRLYGVFQMNSALGTTKQIRLNFALDNATTGAIYLTQAMLSDGEELAYWTGDMGDPLTAMPVPTKPPSGVGDGDGRRIGYYPEYRLP